MSVKQHIYKMYKQHTHIKKAYLKIFNVKEMCNFQIVELCLVNGSMGQIQREGISLEQFLLSKSTFYLVVYLYSNTFGYEIYKNSLTERTLNKQLKKRKYLNHTFYSKAFIYQEINWCSHMQWVVDEQLLFYQAISRFKFSLLIY